MFGTPGKTNVSNRNYSVFYFLAGVYSIMSRVLVPVDESARSKIAFEKAFERFPDGEILALHVIQVTDLPDGEEKSATDLAIDDANEVLRDAEKIADNYDREIEFDTTEGHASRAIVSYAEEHDVDRIVMESSDQSGIERLVVGSVAESVKEDAPCPVTIVR